MEAAHGVAPGPEDDWDWENATAMAEKSKSNAANAAPPTKEPATPAKKLPTKTIGIVAVVLLIEGLAISGVFMLAGRPKPVQAEIAARDVAAEAEKKVELLVVADRFQNTRSGKTFLYDTEIYAVVKKKDEERLKKELESRKAHLVDEIGMVFRRAEPSQLLEPSLATLKRQVRATLDSQLEAGDGLSPIEDVLIPRCIQFRVEY